MMLTSARLCRTVLISSRGTILRKQTRMKSKKAKKCGREDEECKTAAVVLAGSGYLDGTCVHEASAVAVNLTKQEVIPMFYAPNLIHPCVMDHQKLCPVHEKRCVLPESARIARSQIQPLSNLRHCDASCLIVPGGFGVAQTLSTYQKDKECCNIEPEMMRVLEEFHDVKKPMGFICIAAILPARMFPCVKITLGMKGNPKMWPHQEAIDVAEDMGAEVENRNVDEFSFDKQHMVFTTPAFMYAGQYHEIFEGIGRMVENMCRYLE